MIFAQKLIGMGHTGSSLDDLVHDHASLKSTVIKNSCRETQLEFLSETLGVKVDLSNLDEEDLCEFVENKMSDFGSSINNSGLSRQLFFLLSECGMTEQQILDAIEE